MMPVIMLVTSVPVEWAILLFSIAFFGQQSWSTLVMIVPTDLFERRIVASVAGLDASGQPINPANPPKPAGPGGATDGKTVFATAGCTGCHTLKAAGSTGTVGPNLDEAKPPKDLVIDRVTNGQGGMPSFKGQLSEAQIEALADYVSQNAGK